MPSMANLRPCIFVLLLISLEVICQEEEQPVKLCTFDEFAEACKQMETDVPDLFSCVVGRDSLDCARKMRKGEADITNMNERAIYVAGKHFGGVPIATEIVDGEPHKYSGVALVLKTSDINTPNDLRGRRSCHTGVGRTVGWQVPIATLLARGIIQPEKCAGGSLGSQELLGAVQSFFSGGSCAPGDWSTDPTLDKELKSRYPDLCKQCKNPDTCSHDDEYAGYKGVVKCLIEEAGDVAFTKIPILRELLQKDPSLADKVDLLCLEGNRQTITADSDLKDACTWGFRPSNAFVAHEDNYKQNADRLLSVLADVQVRYPPPHVRTPDWYYKSFLSDPDITGVNPVGPSRDDYRSYLGDFINVIEGPPCSEHDTPAVWCVTSEEERQKCQDYARAAESRAIYPPVECVLASSKIACMENVKDGHAQLVNLDGGDVYKAGRYYGLKPLAAELYGESDASYYAVAVIRSASDVTKLSELRGLKSCHTGMGRTAGWVIPIGALLKDGGMEDDCDRVTSIAHFFDGSCVPGANDTKYNPGRVEGEKLCRQCVGDQDGQHKCARDSKERYSGYAGALRCLAEGRGDVAFVKHTTVPQYTDNKSTAPWAKDLLSSDFQLLCAHGGTATVEEYKTCNLAKVPSHYVMTRGNADEHRSLELSKGLADSAKYFPDDEFLFRLFARYEENPDLLFKDSTTDLKVVPLGTSYVDVLGEDFYKASEAVDPKICS